MTKKKFKPGRKIKTMSELSKWLARGNWTYWHNKPIHCGWMISMPFRTLQGAVYSRILTRAVKNDS